MRGAVVDRLAFGLQVSGGSCRISSDRRLQSGVSYDYKTKSM